MSFLRFVPLAAVAVSLLAGASAQTTGTSALPPIAPTRALDTSGANSVAPLSAVATSADRAGARHHRARVSCTAGQLEVRADNSSLNSILRDVSRCTGMRITGGVADQRVYGNYGPAMPATVIATLLDGTGTNVLLRETAEDQPSELILTPRTAGPTPPNPSQVPDDDPDDGPPALASTNSAHPMAATPASARNRPASAIAPPSTFPTPAAAGGVISGPVSIPQPLNNVMGSPNNVSPDVATYPTTNSVPLDSLPTPSTTPNQAGIVTAPNPPPAGSDTAALLNGRPADTSGDTSVADQPPSAGTPANNPGGPGATGTAGANGTLTPQQVFDQLQRLRQQQGNPQ